MRKVELINSILNSFEKMTGKSIIERTNPEFYLQKIEEGEFALVSHNGASDPILNYGNKFALKLWEMDWYEFIKTPSKKTAEPEIRFNRKEMLSIVSKQGFIDQYEGIRISSTGKRFKIKNAVIWNVLDENGKFLGQAAYFNSVEFLS